jgi:cell wall-associated NlpC family hydrolase
VTRHTPPSVTRLAAVLALGALLASGLPEAAHASPVGDAKKQAAALRVRVDGLRTQAEIATEDYDAAYAQLGVAVTEHLSAERALQVAQQASGTASNRTSLRVRALYMSGGTSALYARVLASTSVAEMADRVQQVQAVLREDRTATRDAGQVVAGRQAAEKRLADNAATSIRLQKRVADRADAVRGLLAQTDALLAAADSRVRVLAEQQRLAEEAAAAVQAAATLAAATASSAIQGPLPPLPNVPTSPLAAAALAFAQAQLGKPYVWGAVGPSSYDCSGLTGAAYAAAGVHLPRVASQQWYSGPHIALADLQPGDLMFWASNLNDPNSIHHVAFYLGNSMMLAAPHTGDVVKIQPVYLDGYLGAVRPGVAVAPAP